MLRSLDGLYEELVRVRERLHNLAQTVTVNTTQIEAHSKLMSALTEKVSKMETADVIATEVAKRIRAMGDEEKDLHEFKLTTWQKRVGLLAAFVAIVVPVVNIVLVGGHG